MTHHGEELLSITTSTYGSGTVLKVSGAIDLATADILRTHLKEVLAEEPSALVLDLSNVDFLASVGIQLLVETHQKLKPGNFTIVAQSRQVIRPLALTHLDDLLHIVPTLPEGH